MKVFKDRNGKEWTLEANVGALDRVNDLVGVDLLDLSDGANSLLLKSINDPLSIGKITWAMIKPQADRNNTSKDEYLDALDGEALARARDAFLDELPSFFFDQDQKEGVRLLIRKMKEVQSVALKEMVKAIDGLDLSDLVRASVQTSGNSPESVG